MIRVMHRRMKGIKLKNPKEINLPGFLGVTHDLLKRISKNEIRIYLPTFSFLV